MISVNVCLPLWARNFASKCWALIGNDYLSSWKILNAIISRLPELSTTDFRRMRMFGTSYLSVLSFIRSTLLCGLSIMPHWLGLVRLFKLWTIIKGLCVCTILSTYQNYVSVGRRVSAEKTISADLPSTADRSQGATCILQVSELKVSGNGWTLRCRWHRKSGDAGCIPLFEATSRITHTRWSIANLIDF